MTDRTLEADAHAVLLPATDRMDLSDAGRRFLDSGGCAWLLGESRSEYVARRMSPERLARETAEDFLGLALEIRRRSGSALIAVDQEPGGICRLEGHVPPWPDPAQWAQLPIAEAERHAARVAKAARSLGVNVFLAPIMDRVTGQNPWLAGRTPLSDAADIARIATTMVRGVQSAGVAAVAKHFPGYAHIALDPAIDAAAVETSPLPEVLNGIRLFETVIGVDVQMIMVGPAIVSALDPVRPALRSPRVVGRLVKDMGYRGIVLADDLDSKATLLGDSVATAAVDALAAGCDMLLLADTGSQLQDVPRAIVAAVRSGVLSRDALTRSANKIRALARRLDDAQPVEDANV